MILKCDKLFPEHLPDGYHYYIFQVESETVNCYGCFIGESRDDIFETDAATEFKTFPNAVIRVSETNRRFYIHFWEIIECQKIKKSMQSVTPDSPAA